MNLKFPRILTIELSFGLARADRLQRIDCVQNSAQQAQRRRDDVSPRGIPIGDGDDCDDDADDVSNGHEQVNDRHDDGATYPTGLWNIANEQQINEHRNSQRGESQNPQIPRRMESKPQSDQHAGRSQDLQYADDPMRRFNKFHVASKSAHLQFLSSSVQNRKSAKRYSRSNR